VELADLAELDDRQIAIILSRARCVVGLSCVFVPSVFAGVVLGDTKPATRAAVRFAGIRDLALGVGALNSLKEGTQDAEWVSMGAVSDGFDGVVLCVARRLPLRSRLFGAAAVGLGGYLLYLSRLLSDQRAQPDPT
jgi:hypothetical protein